jgi:hypothetical protein
MTLPGTIKTGIRVFDKIKTLNTVKMKTVDKPQRAPVVDKRTSFYNCGFFCHFDKIIVRANEKLRMMEKFMN